MVGYTARMGMRNSYIILAGNRKRRKYMRDPDIVGKILPEFNLHKQGWKMWIKFVSFRIGPNCGLLGPQLWVLRVS
jgi:hypothetical protein